MRVLGCAWCILCSTLLTLETILAPFFVNLHLIG